MTNREKAERLGLGPFANLRCQEELDRESRKRGDLIAAIVVAALAAAVGVLV